MVRLNPGVRAGLCASALSFALPVVAASADENETLVVTASATEQSVKDAPASISVITEEDLQRRPVNNLKDVLKDVPGVQLTNEGDNRKGVSLRGLDSSYTLILVDGKRVNSRNVVFRHNDFDLNWIPVDAIERIEVVRGPMSSLYGSDALGGVVNIITKKVGTKWTSTLSADTTIQEHRDRGDTWNGQFYTSGPLVDGLLGMKAYGSFSKRGKDDQQLSNSGTETPRIEGFTSRDGNVEFAWTPNENNDITAGYGFDRQDRDSDSLDKNRIERQNYSLSHNGRWDVGNSEIRVYGEKVDNKNPGNSGQITSESNTLDGKYVLPLGMINQMVTFGGEWRHDKLKDPVNLTSNSGGSTSASQYALFLEDEWRIFEPLALTTGIRMDDHDTYGDHWSPRAYLVYTATDTVTVKGGWATAFKAPSLLQLSPDWATNSCRGSCRIVGSKDLKPETSESFELGLYYSGEEGWLEGVQGSITAFQNNVEDMINVNRTSDASEAPGYPNFVGWYTGSNGKRIPVFSYYNVDKARINGVETELKIPLGEEWKLTTNYTYTDGRDLSNGGNKPLKERPFHTANGRVDWNPWQDWSFYVAANYSGKQRAVNASSKTPGGYTTWDIGGAWQATKDVKLRAGVLNVGDKDLQRDDYSYNEDGRRYFMAVDYRF
ncbi:catecholate siderophore receptor CirA [Yokenella regensburgei]|jgi:outer membrane receptor for ferrienterochelin and colicins|uniref:Colicin I receptor n=1 Tax=Yokenella regensburgei TaxID=158877 RepID=A0AB38FXW6_9ENTR|nr:catecholate siderophore receptor CirA [Yokenella regensburgei]KFD22185.1 colicin I receptor [Yokenella regensburgei ATCC 49455]MDQ4428645.1 catecholate siderophore receptor CirA [Yokenella regensburgei]RKR63726.1 outer membrane receptor for ferrienterochelin and colicins [Yokenella regensburgei]SQA63985.1 Colicin I receptor precursor [Yokenella regensburgei]SQA66095.1 Colicin I receptor precursor [Yokenella regensburgei]